MVELLKKSSVKDYAKKVNKDMRFPDETIESLEKAVKELINKAIDRAKKNGRKTVRDSDI